MENILSKLISKKDLKDFADFLFVIKSQQNRYLLRNDILLQFDEFCNRYNKTERYKKQSSIIKFFNYVPELLIMKDFIFITHRYAIAKYRFYQVSINGEYAEEIDIRTYLKNKENYATEESGRRSMPALEIDYMPFYDYSPVMRDSKTIGDGIRFLNKHLSSSLFQRPDEWGKKLFEFIKLHKINGKALLINGDVIQEKEALVDELEWALEWLASIDASKSSDSVKSKLKKRGFEEGWGNTVGRCRETMKLLYDLFNEPDSTLIESFISRVPMIFKVAIISPHGWFGQENVLGKPDTGGQVIYILDQVRALEQYMLQKFQLAGVNVTPKIIILTRLIPNAGNTTCGERLEKVFRTNNCWILRIPFKNEDNQIVNDWISRFNVWSYLDRFAYDARSELLSEFQGRPDLLIGNYSDGNLVATLLSDKLNVIQCTIAHALEKTKYLFSDLFWEHMESNYHFSLQFTADMIAMNKSDFIITSTYQEIAGTETTIGQYESYQFFTMPGLYRVTGGINLFNPKFNVVPPGVDENNYFPYYEKEKRSVSKKNYWEDRLFSEKAPDVYGILDKPEKPPIFTMARLDKIKNITGLIEAFGTDAILRESCNLIFAAGTTKLEESDDREEQEEIRKAHRLIQDLKLHGSVRWLPSINKADTGIVYRIIADRKGVFVQPALFEAFGLTILEAMLSGIPTFGPQFGGPSEIIEDKKSGFLMNTSQPRLMADVISSFFKQCKKDNQFWNNISEAGIKRVKEKFTWDLYSEKLLNLTQLYGFWRYSVALEGMKKLDRYSDVIYHLLFRKRADSL